ncbi:hypothetical protein [Candidatus Chlamydia sanziniae]|uniref:Uncharacterized protein n=1 Tax=Candidatus Chlamydia sanziniae TaxID=1806891 RepID=A0A1A9HVT5_9CHLA|nr:hypothetical protein [Candidatus Chlamydia sanziniae]ANH79109.1 hypothetical protein Cs308_0939 [Candidatus Chlamydia sanziniae]
MTKILANQNAKQFTQTSPTLPIEGQTSKATRLKKIQEILLRIFQVASILLSIGIFVAVAVLSYVSVSLTTMYAVLLPMMITSILLMLILLIIGVIKKPDLPRIKMPTTTLETKPKPYNNFFTSSALEQSYILHTEPSEKNLPILNAKNILQYKLKASPKIKLITAQAPNLPTIYPQEKNCLHRLFLLPPENSVRSPLNLPSSSPLTDLQADLGDESWNKMKGEMNICPRQGYWQCFPYKDINQQSCNEELILAWSPWGYYNADLEKMLDSTKNTSYIPPYIANPQKCATYYFTYLFYELMTQGKAEVHLHAEDAFNPINHTGNSTYDNKFVKLLPAYLLNGLCKAVQQASSALKDDMLSEIAKKNLQKILNKGFVLYLTKASGNPLKE